MKDAYRHNNATVWIYAQFQKNDEEKSKTVSRIKGRLSNANSYSDYADYTLDDHILKDCLLYTKNVASLPSTFLSFQTIRLLAVSKSTSSTTTVVFG